MDEIQKIYIALFGRPADPLGLSFWTEKTQGGADLAGLDAMIGTVEYAARFEGHTNAEIVRAIYQVLFNRAADEEGLKFFIEQMELGKQTLSSIAINIAQGAQGDDLASLNAKVLAANLFTFQIHSDADLAKYAGADGAALGRAYLAAVTSNPLTMPGSDTVRDLLDPKPATPPPAPQPAPESDITLTTGFDHLTAHAALLGAPLALVESSFRFTSGDELVKAAAGTLHYGDLLIDPSSQDADVLRVTTNAGDLYSISNAVVFNIELLDVTVAGATSVDALSLHGYHGLKELKLTATLQANPGQDYIFVDNFARSGLSRIDFSDVTPGNHSEDYVYAHDANAHQSITFIGGAGGDSVLFGNGDNAVSMGDGVGIVTLGDGDNRVETGDGWDFVTVGSGSNLIITGGGVDEIKVGRPGEFGSSTIRPGALGDKVFLNGEGIYTIEVAKFDTGLALGDADKITGFKTGIDKIYFADLPSGTATNYQEAAQPLPGSDHAGALAQANGMFGAAPGTLSYFLINDAHYAYLFINDDGDGYADRMIAFAGLTTNDLAFSDLT